MEIPKLIILLCCTYCAVASHHSHVIPVEGYETELQDLGQHVDLHETPVKVVKITKTIAVKIPVPYPVKVREKVPYPVHVSKPYPVPVPQIIKVPHVVTVQSKPTQHEAIDAGHGGWQGPQQYGGQGGSSYQVQEAPSHELSGAGGGHSFVPLPDNQSYGGFNSGLGQNFGAGGDEHLSDGSTGGSYDGAPNSYYGYSDDSEGNGSLESKSYDRAINDYLQTHSIGNNAGQSSDGYHYH